MLLKKYERLSDKITLSSIKDAYDVGIDLRTSKVQKNAYRKLYRAGCRWFGDWKSALSAAGIDYDEVVEKATSSRREQERQTLLADIRAAYDSGVALNASALQQSDNPLYYRSQRFYEGRFFWGCLKNRILARNKGVRGVRSRDGRLYGLVGKRMQK